MNRTRQLKILLLAGSLVLVLPACSAILSPIIDDVMNQVTGQLGEQIHGFVHEAANKPPPPAPAPGSSWSDYLVWAGTVLVGSIAVLVDRRRFHNKKLAGSG